MKFTTFRKASGFRAAIVGMAVLLPACSFTEDALWPSLTGEDPAGGTEQTQEAQSGDQMAAAGTAPVVAPAPTPALGNSNFQPDGVTPGKQTGTFVGKKVVELRSELKRLQARERR